MLFPTLLYRAAWELSAAFQEFTGFFRRSFRIRRLTLETASSVASGLEWDFTTYGWLTASGMNWEDYRTVFRKYRHALYITNVSKEKPEQTTELNYQFLTTVSIQGDEFRPADLPDGWDHSPETDERNWLTKQTELAYYNFCADESFRQNYFLEKFERVSWWERHQGKDQILAAVLKKNPSFINEPVYTLHLETNP